MRRPGRKTHFCALVAGILLVTAVAPANADYISPKIHDKGHLYSTEKARSEFFGTGVAGRMSEASHLRFETESALQERDFEKAVKTAKKAVQLDPGFPEGHLLLARALTGKFYMLEGEIDEKLLHDAIREWKMIRYHDADISEQWEAKTQLKKLSHVSKALEKDRQKKKKLQEEQLARGAQLAKTASEATQAHQKKTAVDTALSTTNRVASDKKEESVAGTDGNNTASNRQNPRVAQKRKRFVLF